MYFFLRVHSQGFFAIEVFWGLWLLPMAALTIRSGFVPRLVSAGLIVAGTAYVVASFVSLVLPQFISVMSSVAIPAEAGELGIVIWLLVTRRADVPTAAIAPATTT